MRRWISLLLFPTCVLAQGSVPLEFPPDATAVSEDVLRTRVAGKVFNAQPAQGVSWKLDYRANGYMFLETSSGYRDTGTWSVEGDKLCGHWQKLGPSCSTTRVNDEVIYIKRVSNGEIVRMIAQ